MLLKQGVNPEGVCPQIWYAIGVVQRVYASWGEQLVITSLRDGTHGPRSKHPKGEAADYRTRDLDPSETTSIFHAIKSLLDPLGFDAVLEDDHIHQEWDPKEGENWLTFVP